MALEIVRFLVQDMEAPPSPIPGVAVRVFDAGGVFVTSGTTDALGIVDITLDGAVSPGTQYLIRLYKFGVSFDSPASIYVISPAPVPEGNNFKAYGDINAASAPSDARLCRCHGYLRDARGDAWRGRIRFTLYSPDIVDQTAILSRELTVEADSYGYFLVDLFRTGVYVAQVEGISSDERRVTVPDASTINIADLLYPVILYISYSPAAPFALAVGATLEVTPTVVASDGRVLTGIAAQDLIWSVDDETVASVTLDAATLTLLGLSAGSASLTAVRNDASISRIPDTITGGTSSIVVT